MRFTGNKNLIIVVGIVMTVMLIYFLLANPALNDDGFHYEGFAEAAAKGKVDFKNFYGFQGLSFLAVPVYWVTHSPISIVIASMILSLWSLPLAYLVGKEYYQNEQAGLFFMAAILLMPYPYTTMMRGFQEAALLFFVLLIIYGSIKKSRWTPLAWAGGGLVKPFALTLFPLWMRDFLNWKRVGWVLAAATLGAVYLGTSYLQTGHLINNAALNSYQGLFDTGNPPSLEESFSFGIKGFGRVLANLSIYSRKILISPLLLLLSVWFWWREKVLPVRRGAAMAVALNFLLVGSLTFSFQKYLIPLVALMALLGTGALMKHRMIRLLVLIDSWFVFKPIYDYFGHNFWPDPWVYFVPLVLAGILLFFPFKNRLNLLS